MIAGSLDFTAINSLTPNSVLGGLPVGTKFNSVIHSFDALLPTYNIPVRATLVMKCVHVFDVFLLVSFVLVQGLNNVALNLTQDALTKIWNNQILWWNDSAITSINAAVTMPPERIRILYRPDSAGTTVQWILHFQIVNSSYPVGATAAPASSSYPFWNKNCAPSGTSFSSCQPYMVPATIATAMTAARMMTTPYATGYIARPFAAAFGVPSFNMKKCVQFDLPHPCVPYFTYFTRAAKPASLLRPRLPLWLLPSTMPCNRPLMPTSQE
jgi:hypothetical protein